MTGDVVDSVALCELLPAAGFSGCDALPEPQRERVLPAHQAPGTRAFFDRDVFLYPHRIASFFSTAPRAARGQVALDAV